MSTFILDDYIVDKKRIGKGSFSTIYKGYHKYNNRLYAIKEVSVDNIKNIKENIKREFNLMKKLNHQNIVKLHNVIIDNKYDNIYLVLDYHKNGDLSKFLNKRPLKELYSQKYMIQLRDGLKYLYDNNIIHRDLKPQNILLNESYDLKIADFGFARYFDNDNMIQTLCGSPMYMAPEISRKKKYDAKSDLWSVGIILYEMLSGIPPFNARNLIDLLKKIEKMKKVTLPNNIIVSESCKNLLNRLLQKEPDKRITWGDFFEHEWLRTNTVLKNENNLMEIDFTASGVNTVLPNLDEFKKNQNQFNSFKHKSIVDNIKSNLEESNEIDNLSLENLHFKVNFSQESDEIDSESDYKSDLEDSGDNTNIDLECSFIDNKHSMFERSKPINIKPNKESKYVTITDDMIYSKKIFNSINNDYVLVNNIKPQSEPNPSMSFKEYLSSSINFIKQSYNYISSNKSI